MTEFTKIMESSVFLIPSYSSSIRIKTTLGSHSVCPRVTIKTYLTYLCFRRGGLGEVPCQLKTVPFSDHYNTILESIQVLSNEKQ